MWGRKKLDMTNEDEVQQERGGKFQIEQFRGYCKGPGKSGYIPMTVPKSTSTS